MEGTRLRLLDLLQRTHGATVGQLAQVLGLSPATIRHHLEVLQRDNLVTYRVVRHGLGRPEHLYYLTDKGEEALPKRYDRLILRLLHTLDHQEGLPSSLDHLFARVARLLLEERGEEWALAPFGERLRTLLHLLEEWAFSPQVEEGEGGLRIHLHNCPFRCVALENKAVCTLDATLIALALGGEVAQEQCIVHKDHHCTYRVARGPS